MNFSMDRLFGEEQLKTPHSCIFYYSLVFSIVLTARVFISDSALCLGTSINWRDQGDLITFNLNLSQWSIILLLLFIQTVSIEKFISCSLNDFYPKLTKSTWSILTIIIPVIINLIIWIMFAFRLEPWQWSISSTIQLLCSSLMLRW